MLTLTLLSLPCHFTSCVSSFIYKRTDWWCVSSGHRWCKVTRMHAYNSKQLSAYSSLSPGVGWNRLEPGAHNIQLVRSMVHCWTLWSDATGRTQLFSALLTVFPSLFSYVYSYTFTVTVYTCLSPAQVFSLVPEASTVCMFYHVTGSSLTVDYFIITWRTMLLRRFIYGSLAHARRLSLCVCSSVFLIYSYWAVAYKAKATWLPKPAANRRA